MRDAIVTALSVIALIAASVGIGSLPFIGYHQVFVEQGSALVH